MSDAQEVVTTSLAVWFVATVLYQFRDTPFRRLARWDWFHLLPSWSFFAPNPGRSDYYLVIRDRLPGGRNTEWEMVPTLRPRSLLHVVWHPARRVNKAVMDMVNRLARSGFTEQPEADRLQFHSAYLILLAYVSGLPRLDPDARYRQFLLVQRFGSASSEPPRIVLRSRFHDLG